MVVITKIDLKRSLPDVTGAREERSLFHLYCVGKGAHGRLHGVDRGPFVTRILDLTGDFQGKHLISRCECGAVAAHASAQVCHRFRQLSSFRFDSRLQCDIFGIYRDLAQAVLHVFGCGFLEARLQMFTEKALHSHDHRQIVYWTGEAVAFIRRHQIGDIDSALAQCDDDLIGFPLVDARIVSALHHHEQRANDPRVNKRESDQIVVALRERGIDVAYLVAPDEGHGFARPVNNLAMIMAMERFLGEHLQARFQESATEEVKNRLREITVDPKDVTLQPRIEPEAGELPEPVTDLRAGVSRYRATLTAGDQMFALEVSSEIQDAGDKWTAIHTMQTPMGTFTDTVEMEKRTLLARARHIRQGPLQIDLRYDDHRASGTLSMDGQTKPVAIDLGGPVFADAAGAMESIAALPLREGYRAVFRNVDIDRQKAKWMQLRVLKCEQVTVPAGVFETYRIAVEPAEGGAGTTTIWVEKQQRKPVKYQSVLPEMGGAVLTAELLGS